MSRLLLLFLAFVVSSCDMLEDAPVSDKGKPLARFKDKTLFMQDVAPLLPSNTDSIDSLVVLKSLINNWIEEQVLLDRAYLNLTAEQLNFERQIEDYRKSLILFNYEQEVLRQKLDTNVSDEELRQYYDENMQNFELKDYVVRVNFIKVDKNAPKIKKVKEWMFSGDADDLNNLEDYCIQYASGFILDNQWMYFDELTEFIPIQTINVEHFLKTTRKVESEDDKFIYLLMISEFKLKNSTSPFALEEERIRTIILNRRKLNYLSSLRKSLVSDAMSKNEAEVLP
jgi:hypothetical protein